MKKAFQIFLFLIAVICSVLPLRGADHYFFRNYIDKLSLSRQTILCIQQDPLGYMWFSSNYGIFRFDGNHSYMLNDLFKQVGSSFNGYQAHIFIDSSGRMFLPGGNVMNVMTNQYLPSFYNGDKYTDVVEDKNECVWIPFERYLRKENLRTNKSIVYTNCRVLKADVTDDSYFFLTPDGWLKRMPLQGKAIYQTLLRCEITNITSFCCANDNEILIGTDKKELFLVDIKARKIYKLSSGIYVRDIKKYNANECWIASETGIYVYDRQSRSLTNIRKNPFNPSSLQDDVTYSLFKDKNGGMWIGHYSKGLSYAPVRICDFNLCVPLQTEHDMRGYIVREFCADPLGNVWIGTEDNGLNCYNPSHHTFINFSPTQPAHHIGTTNIHGLAMINGNLWFGSFDDGIGILDIHSKRLVKHFKKNDGSGLIDNFVFSILQSNKYGTLIGTSMGVQRYNQSTGKFEKFRQAEDSGLCFQLFMDSRQRLWMDRSTRLECLLPNGKKLIYNFHDNNIKQIYEGPTGTIWVATDKGLGYLNTHNNNFISVLIGGKVVPSLRVIEDENKALWISTQNGLIYFNPTTKESKTFSTIDGLPTNSFNVSSSFRDSEGKLYFGTTEGFISFFPQSLNFNVDVPTIAFSRFIASGINKSDTLFYGDRQKKTPRFCHDQNSITVDFAALQYSIAENLDFQYQLNGLENKWHTLHGYNTITYPSLPPGRYVLRLKSTDARGRWAENEITYTFAIEPPFYLSGFALFLYLLLFSYAVYYAYQQSKKRIRKRHQREIDELNREKEKELYNTKINFFTTIAHEIRTPLTLIKAPLENVIDRNRNEKDVEELNLVERNVKRLNNLCSQLLEFRKMESSQLQLNFVITNVSSVVSDVLYNFGGMMKEKGISCVDNLKSQDFAAAIDQEVFTKIVSNLMANACKYASSLVKVTLLQTDDDFSLSVCNDGKLISEKDKGHIFSMFYRANTGQGKMGTGIGLSFSRALAEMHKGTLNLVDNEDGLNEFVLTMPKKQEITFQKVYSSDSVAEQNLLVASSEESDKRPVLIVEDEKEIREFIKSSLSVLYKVYEASNGLQAVKVLENNAVDIVVTDVMMPKMDGCELCREIKNRMEWSSIPVVMLTAKVNVEARLEGYAAGAEEYIDKPFSMKYLMSRLEDILKKSDQRIKLMKESTDTDAMIQNIMNRTDRAFINSFATLIKDEIGNDQLDAELISKRLKVSPSTLYRRCKQLLGVSPVEYIRVERLKKAKQLLMIDNVRISDVAYEIGFSTPSYFTLCFSKEFGISPTDYIRQKQKE